MRFFRSLLSLSLAALVLVASSSFYMTAHSCGGTVNEIAFLEQADGCGHAKLPPCHRQMMKGCCEDETITHEGQDLKQEGKLTLHPSFISFEVIITPVVLAEVIPSSQQASHYSFFYDTPLLACDRTINLHTLLI